MVKIYDIENPQPKPISSAAASSLAAQSPSPSSLISSSLMLFKQWSQQLDSKSPSTLKSLSPQIKSQESNEMAIQRAFEAKQRGLRLCKYSIFLLYIFRNVWNWSFTMPNSSSSSYHMHILVSNIIVLFFQIIPFILNFISDYHQVYSNMYQQRVRHCIVIGSTLAMGLELLMRSRNGQCASDNIFKIWDCNPNEHGLMLPVDSLVILLITPVTFISLFRTSSLLIVLVTTSLMLLFLLLATLLVTKDSNAKYGLFYGAISSIITIMVLYLQYSIVGDIDRCNEDDNAHVEVKRNISIDDAILDMCIETGTVPKLKGIRGNDSHRINASMNTNRRGNNNSDRIGSSHINSGKSSKSTLTTTRTASSDNSGKSSRSSYSSRKTSAKQILLRLSNTFNFGTYFGLKKEQDEGDDGEAHMSALEKLITPEGMMNEFKNMISNNAHELKTPLAAILSGIELFNQVSLDMESKLNSHENFFRGPLETLLTMLREDIKALLLASKSMFSTNSCMLMSINRTIDYSKVKNNIPLTPRTEIVKVKQLIQMCIDTVRDLNPSANIVVANTESDGELSAATDRQWLHDNILCLLANAVKYSERGELVSIRVDLRGRQMLGSTSDDPFDALCPSVSLSVREDQTHRITSAAGSVTVEPDAAQHINFANGSPLRRRENQDKSTEEMVYVEVTDGGNSKINAEMITRFFEMPDLSSNPSGNMGLGLHCIALRMKALGGSYGYTPRFDSPGSQFWFAFPYVHSATTKVTFQETRQEPAIEIVGEGSSRSSRSSLSYDLDDGGISMRRSTSTRHKPSTSLNDEMSAENDLKLYPSQQPASVHIPPLRRVLVVDDSPTVLKLTSSMLRRKGFYAETATDGNTALLKIENAIQQFQIVLMDIQMPVSDGIEAIVRIRQHESVLSAAHRANLRRAARKERNSDQNSEGSVSFSESVSLSSLPPKLPKIFIVAVSASNDTKTVEQSFAAGADLYIAKPVTADSMQEVMRYIEERENSEASLSANKPTNQVLNALNTTANPGRPPRSPDRGKKTRIVLPSTDSQDEMLVVPDNNGIINRPGDGPRKVGYASESSAEDSGPDAIHKVPSNGSVSN